jgi:TPR repeat protein
MGRSSIFHEAIRAYDNGNALEALRLMEECAGAGDPVACFTAALWYCGEEGIPADPIRSKQWLVRLEKLAEEGNHEAQWELGQQHRFGNLLAKSVERANYWLERSAEGGYGDAQHHLAWYFETGQYGYPLDQAAAADWYQRAFQQGNPETLYLFAMRQFKDGLPTEEAIRLLRIASDKGLKQAEHALAACTH